MRGDQGNKRREENGHIEPEGLPVLERFRRKPCKVLLEEKIVDELAAVPEGDGDVPGRRDPQKHDDGNRPQQVAPPAAARPDQGRGQHERHQALRQDRQAEERSGRCQHAPVAVRDPPQREQHGRRERRGHGQVGHADMAEAQPGGGGRKNGRCEQRGTLPEFAAKHPPVEEQEQNRDDRHRQARREIFTQPGAKPGRDHPVHERRLLEPRLAPEPGREPIARSGHLAADGGVARLIRPQQSDAGEVVEEEEIARSG